MTRSDTDPTNYTYTITYLPDNIDNGTEVTVSGSSIYAGVSKSFAFSFTGTKSNMYYWHHVSMYYIKDPSKVDTKYTANGVSLHTSSQSDFTSKKITLLPTINVKKNVISDTSTVFEGWISVPQSDPTLDVITSINKTTGKVNTMSRDITVWNIYFVLWEYNTVSTSQQNWYVVTSEFTDLSSWTLSETQPD